MLFCGFGIDQGSGVVGGGGGWWGVVGGLGGSGGCNRSRCSLLPEEPSQPQILEITKEMCSRGLKVEVEQTFSRPPRPPPPILWISTPPPHADAEDGGFTNS